MKGLTTLLLLTISAFAVRNEVIKGTRFLQIEDDGAETGSGELHVEWSVSVTSESGETSSESGETFIADEENWEFCLTDELIYADEVTEDVTE